MSDLMLQCGSIAQSIARPTSNSRPFGNLAAHSLSCNYAAQLALHMKARCCCNSFYYQWLQCNCKFSARHKVRGSITLQLCKRSCCGMFATRTFLRHSSISLLIFLIFFSWNDLLICFSQFNWWFSNSASLCGIQNCLRLHNAADDVGWQQE